MPAGYGVGKNGRVFYKNAKGQYAPAPRSAGSMVNVRVDVREMLRLTKQLSSETARVATAAKVAHTYLAAQLQEDIATVLEDKVRARGRRQRAKNDGARLADAIRSSDNRRVNQLGFTVGYLDENAAVRPYYRNLEQGSSVHVGRYLSGVFTSKGATDPRPGLRKYGRDARFPQRDPFRYDRPYDPGVKIKNPIIGYRYIEGGIDNFVGRGGTTTLAAAAYTAALKQQGFDALTRATTGGDLNGGRLTSLRGDERQGSGDPSRGRRSTD